ncbi:MAG: hypothetical protein ACRYGG_23940 [Janthinobacterium lividum]
MMNTDIKTRRIDEQIGSDDSFERQHMLLSYKEISPSKMAWSRKNASRRYQNVFLFLPRVVLQNIKRTKDLLGIVALANLRHLKLDMAFLTNQFLDEKSKPVQDPSYGILVRTLLELSSVTTLTKLEITLSASTVHSLSILEYLTSLIANNRNLTYLSIRYYKYEVAQYDEKDEDGEFYPYGNGVRQDTLPFHPVDSKLGSFLAPITALSNLQYLRFPFNLSVGTHTKYYKRLAKMTALQTVYIDVESLGETGLAAVQLVLLTLDKNPSFVDQQGHVGISKTILKVNTCGKNAIRALTRLQKDPIKHNVEIKWYGGNKLSFGPISGNITLLNVNDYELMSGIVGYEIYGTTGNYEDDIKAYAKPNRYNITTLKCLIEKNMKSFKRLRSLTLSMWHTANYEFDFLCRFLKGLNTLEHYQSLVPYYKEDNTRDLTSSKEDRLFTLLNILSANPLRSLCLGIQRNSFTFKEFQTIVETITSMVTLETLHLVFAPLDRSLHHTTKSSLKLFDRMPALKDINIQLPVIWDHWNLEPIFQGSPSENNLKRMKKISLYASDCEDPETELNLLMASLEGYSIQELSLGGRTVEHINQMLNYLDGVITKSQSKHQDLLVKHCSNDCCQLTSIWHLIINLSYSDKFIIDAERYPETNPYAVLEKIEKQLQRWTWLHKLTIRLDESKRWLFQYKAGEDETPLDRFPILTSTWAHEHGVSVQLETAKDIFNFQQEGN